MVAEFILAGALCGEPCQRVSLDLPAGTVYEQLQVLSRARHLSFMFSWGEVNPNMPVPALRGAYTVPHALDRILSSTPYTWEWDNRQTFRAFVIWLPRTCAVLGVDGRYPLPPCRQLVRR